MLHIKALIGEPLSNALIDIHFEYAVIQYR